MILSADPPEAGGLGVMGTVDGATSAVLLCDGVLLLGAIRALQLWPPCGISGGRRVSAVRGALRSGR
jgi:hypothetical protein